MHAKRTDKDFLTSRFDRLTPIRLAVDGYAKDRKWECRCDCGNTKVVYQYTLTRTSWFSKSCGCTWGTKLTGKNHPLFRGCGEMGNHYFYGVQKNARVREVEFSITKEFAWDLFERQERKCAISGVPITMATQTETRRTGVKQTASLDQIEPGKGYTETNVQWCHSLVNLMKCDFPLNEFLERCKLVAEHHPVPVLTT